MVHITQMVHITNMERIQRAAEKEGINYTIVEQLFCSGSVVVDVSEGMDSKNAYLIWDSNSEEIIYATKQAGRMIKKVNELNNAL